MAGACTVAVKVNVVPTVGSETEGMLAFTAGTVPTEVIKGQPLVGNTAFTLDLGDVAIGSGFLLYLRAIVGNFYFLLGATSGTPILTTAHLYIKEGEAYPIPINPNATIMTGVRGISDSATGQLEYILVGK